MLNALLNGLSIKHPLSSYLYRQRLVLFQPLSEKLFSRWKLIQKITTNLCAENMRFQGIFLTSLPQSSEIIVEEEQKDFKNQMTREYAGRLCVLVMAEATPIRSHQHECLNVS